MKRRQWLQWASAAGGAVLLGGACGASNGSSSPDARGGGNGPDGAPGSPDAATGDGGASCQPTTSDVQGPFFEPGAPMRMKIADDEEPGERLVLSGTVVADDCETPIEGALLDVWQADVNGGYHGAGADFRLRGQILTGADGSFMVDTIRPGNYTLSAGVWRPAHIHFTATKPGFRSLTTQLYFAGDPFLPPNDGCTTCGSDDPDRIINLAGDAETGWTGQWRIVLART